MIFGNIAAVFLAVLLFLPTAECFQFLSDMLDLAIFFQHFEFFLQIFDLCVQVIQLTDKMRPFNKCRHRSTTNLIRLNTVCGDNIFCDACHLHIATVDSITNKLVLLSFRSDLSDFDSRNIHHTTHILCDTPFDLLGFIIPAQRFRSCKFRPRIAFFLLGKHKFQVDLVFGIVLNKHSEICTFCKEVLKVFADLDYLIYREFQFSFPR